MNNLQQLEKMRREKKIGYFACGNTSGVGEDRAAFCTLWSYPTSIILAIAEAPTIEQAIDKALSKLENKPVEVTTKPTPHLVTRMPG